MKRYFLKFCNFYYWWLDKLFKKQYIKKYPKYLRRLGINIPQDMGDSWISPTVFFDGTDYSQITLGRDLTISFDVALLIHDYSINNSLRYTGNTVEGENHKMIVKPIIVGNNCFIGARAFIMPGATIEDNCVIGACSVVTGRIPEGSIAAGNPARVIGKVDRIADKYSDSPCVKSDTR